MWERRGSFPRMERQSNWKRKTEGVKNSPLVELTRPSTSAPERQKCCSPRDICNATLKTHMYFSSREVDILNL